jgi:hypothetical protein
MIDYTDYGIQMTEKHNSSMHVELNTTLQETLLNYN